MKTMMALKVLVIKKEKRKQVMKTLNIAKSFYAYTLILKLDKVYISVAIIIIIIIIIIISAPPKVRGLEVCLPYIDSTLPINSQTLPSSLRNQFNKIRDDGTQNTYLKSKYMILNERTSKYDPLSSCLVDFKGRANVASVKNFQLVESTPAQFVTTDMLQTDADKEYILQMGKTTEDCFNMDYKHPLSLLQAFAICIARFDAKLSW